MAAASSSPARPAGSARRWRERSRRPARRVHGGGPGPGAVDELVGRLRGHGHAASAPTCVTCGTRRARRARPRGARRASTCWPTSRRCSVAGASLDEVTEDDWDLQHDINLKAAFFLVSGGGHAHDRAGPGRPDHHLQLAGLVDRWLRRLRGLCLDQGRRHDDDAEDWPARSGRTASRSTASRPARSIRRCS